DVLLRLSHFDGQLGMRNDHISGFDAPAAPIFARPDSPSSFPELEQAALVVDPSVWRYLLHPVRDCGKLDRLTLMPEKDPWRPQGDRLALHLDDPGFSGLHRLEGHRLIRQVNEDDPLGG